MSAPVRFLMVAIAGWALFRGASAGMLPGIEAFAVQRAEAAPVRPVFPAEFPPISPPMPAAPAGPEYAYAGYYPSYSGYQGYAAYPSVVPRYVPVPVYYPAYVPGQSMSVPLPPAQPEPIEPLARALH
jgi:hypothetical protein